MVARRGDIFWVALDPVIGTEIRKTRPGVVVSPDELNASLRRVIVAPITSTVRPWRFRVSAVVADRVSSVVLDQLRTVDTSRLGERLGYMDARTMDDILFALQAMFSP